MPSESDFEPRSPRYGPFLVLAVLSTNNAQFAIFGHFWAISHTFRGARGQERALVYGEMVALVKCMNHLPLFGRYDGVSGPFRAKKGCFRAENAQFWEGTS